MTPTKQDLATDLFIASSIAADVWHQKSNGKAFEFWRFDALSDTGRDAIVISFFDNYPFSPRYIFSRDNGAQAPIPAIIFSYYKDGKPYLRTINEFNSDDFEADRKNPECRIGNSLFRYEEAPYGSGFRVSVDVQLNNQRRLEANFEWLSIESDFLMPVAAEFPRLWNTSIPRADVTGKIVVKTKRGDVLETLNFRGTGYHDQHVNNIGVPADSNSLQWGRAHFADATAIFKVLNRDDESKPEANLLLVRNDELLHMRAECAQFRKRRSIFGISYPTRIRLADKENRKLRVKQIRLLESDFYYLRFLSEFTLTLRDGKPRKTLGITEQINPRLLKHRWLSPLLDMRIGKKGKSPFLS